MVDRFWLDRHGELRLSAQGDWVRFIDHEATIATLRAELEGANYKHDYWKRMHDETRAALIAAEASLAEVRKALERIADVEEYRDGTGLYQFRPALSAQAAHDVASDALARLDTPEKK